MENVYIIRGNSVLDEEELMKLLIEYSITKDESIRDEIFKHNIGLVVSIAKRYKRRDNYDDLVQEGLMGLLKAIETYDINNGSRFSTYAGRCIKNNIFMLLKKESTQIEREHSKVLEYIDDVYKVRGVEPSIAELCQKFGKSEKSIIRILDFRPSLRIEEEREDFSLVDILASDMNIEEDVIEKEHETEKKSMHHIMSELLEELNFKEKTIITFLFGINEEKKNQREIADMTGLTQSYVSRVMRQTLPELKEIIMTTRTLYSSLIQNEGEMRNYRISRIIRHMNDAPLEDIKSIADSTDEIHRQVFYMLNPLDGSKSKTFSEIKEILGINYNQIYECNETVIKMICYKFNKKKSYKKRPYLSNI